MRIRWRRSVWIHEHPVCTTQLQSARPDVRRFAWMAGLALLAPMAHPNPPASQPAASRPAASPAALQREFQQSMTNVELHGHFRACSDLSQHTPLSEPIAEKYSIVSAAPDEGDYWIFTARIQYSEHDVQLPIRVKVLWAGDTPIITVDQIAIPGIGVYSARVMIYRGYYCGAWFGPNYGGVMSGEIRPGAAPVSNP